MSRPRFESNLIAQDYANVRNDKRLQKSLDSQEEILFSDQVTKTNHQGRRQQRVLIVTSEALYNYKPSHYQKPQRRIPLEMIETIFISQESAADLVLKVKDLDNMKLELSRRNTFIKVLQNAIRSKLGKEVERLEVSQGLLVKAWRDAEMTPQKVKKTKELLTSQISTHLDEIQEDGDEEEEQDEPRELSGEQAQQNSPGRFSILRKSLQTVAGAAPKKKDTNNSPPAPKSSSVAAAAAAAQAKKEAKAKRALPVPPKRKTSTLNQIIRRVSANPNTIKYFPRCPPCRVPIGVVQPIWNLMERALEPLLEEDKPAAGLVRCADILLRLVGETGPTSAEAAMKSVAALCFDKDAARALLQSLSDNIPVLGGSALIDSLDALQRCEDPVVRSWAIKSLWKILPMCMSENALPTTSSKWMDALQGSQGEDEEGNINEGEAWFLKTYFRGMIKFGAHEKEPLRRIAKRKGSFSVLGGNFRNSSAFPGGLTPLIVQQAFAQVLLQNMFDVQRRAASFIAAQKKLLQQQQDGAAAAESGRAGSSGGGDLAGSTSITPPLPENVVGGRMKPIGGSFRSFGGSFNSTGVHAGGYDDDAPPCGVVESDCNTVLELLLNSLTRPHDPDRKIEVTGKRICNTMLLPTLMGMLVLVDEDSVRQSVLKDVSLLLLRSETNLKAVLDIPDWQLLFVPLLQTVPKEEKMRTAEQRILHKYVLNLLTMIHTYCFKEPNCRGGPLNTMLGSTFRSLAVFGDWTPDTVGVARWIMFGLVTQLSLTARLWWHDGDAPEWTAFAAIIRTIENFIFFLPDNGARGMAPKSKRSGAENNGNEMTMPMSARDVAERALNRGTNARAGSSFGSFSEDDSDSDEEGGGKDEVRATNGKRRKRKFSITPVYELKGFDPVVRPIGPTEAVKLSHDYDWIASRVADSTDGDSGGGAAGGGGHRSMAQKLSASAVGDRASTGVMGMGGDRKVGLHLNEINGTSNDIKLVEMVIELLKRMGITGNGPEDQRRGELLKTASKKERGLLKAASEWCKAFMTIRELLVDLDLAVETSNQEALTNTMQRIAQFIESRHTVSKASTAKLAMAHTKAVATKLEASVLKQRQLAKQKLEKHADAQPVKVQKTVIVSDNPKSEDAARQASNAAARALAKSQGRGRNNTAQRTNSVVSRTRFYSSLTETNESDAPPPLPPLPALNEEFLAPQAIRRPSKMQARKISFRGAAAGANEAETAFTSVMDEEDEFEELEDGPPCDECGAPVSDEFDAIHQFEFTFHSDCFACDECHLPLLKSENPDENNLFFNDGDLRKFCGAECRMAYLEKGGDSVCPGCMCHFRKGEEAIKSCNRLWHLLHLRCQDCRTVLGVTGKEYFPVEIEAGEVWPFCGPCHSKRFRTCAKCIQPIEAKDDAVDALGRVYHREHFNCFRCGENFKSKEFYVDGHGDAARALCESCWNDANSPRIVCDACGEVLGDSDDAVELGGKIYHAGRSSKKCFKCTRCQKVLQEGEVFEGENSTPLCDDCFYSSSGFRCCACDKVVTGEVLHAEHKTWHPACFSCPECDGLTLSGRYMMTTDANGKPRPVCETHWLLKNATTCTACGLPCTKDILSLGDSEKYHPACLVCSYCTQPLATSKGAHALNKGPDNKWYCNAHADGVCAFPGCSEKCWADGKIYKLANQYFCKPHYLKVSAVYQTDPCKACGSPIKEGEGLQALGKWYHIPAVSRCFCCYICHEAFYDNDDFTTLPGTSEPVHAECIKQ